MVAMSTYGLASGLWVHNQLHAEATLPLQEYKSRLLPEPLRLLLGLWLKDSTLA